MPKRKASSYRGGKRQRTVKGWKQLGTRAWVRTGPPMRRLNARTGGFEGIENKFLDSELSGVSLTTAWLPHNPTGTGCTDSISVPAQGNGESQRIGRMFTIDSILIRGMVASNLQEAAVNPLPDTRARIIVYLDTQTNLAEAAATLIMDAGGADDVFAFRNLQNTKRFRVLFDKTVTLKVDGQMAQGALDAFAVGQIKSRFTFYHKFKGGLKVQCSGTAADVASVTDNNIGIAALCDSTSIGAVLSYSARIRFRG